MNYGNRVSKKIINKKIINFIQNKIKRELQNIISGNEREGEESIIKTAQSFLRRNKEESSKNKGSKYSREQEEEKLVEFISTNNWWITKEYDPENKIGEGAEQKVYLNQNAQTVTKLNDAVFYVYWFDYLNSLLLHNYFFSITCYTLRGFKKENNKLFAIVDQKLINPEKIVNLDHVEQFLINGGFIKPNSFKNDYTNVGLGIILEDLHEENVFTSEGALFFIDTVFYLTDVFYKPVAADYI